MIDSITCNLSSTLEIVQDKPAKRVETGSLLPVNNPVLTILAVLAVMDKFCKHHGIRQTTFMALSLLTNYWFKNNQAITLHTWCKLIYGRVSGNEYHYVRNSKVNLVKRGLVEKVGEKNGHDLYVPTSLAIRSISVIASEE